MTIDIVSIISRSTYCMLETLTYVYANSRILIYEYFVDVTHGIWITICLMALHKCTFGRDCICQVTIGHV